MQVGSLVKHKPWYAAAGPVRTGIVLGSTGKPRPNGIIAKEFILVMWENIELEWEELSILEVIQ